MKRMLSLLLAAVLLCGVLPAGAAVEQTEGFPLYYRGEAASLVVSDADYSQVLRAAGDLQEDVCRVTGETPDLITDGSAPGKYAVLIGSLDSSPMIQSLAEAGKLDAAEAIQGKFEAFTIQVVDAPMAGVEQALVIAGSDKRGTIYGIYDLSAQIGVSPYYWWADVTPVQQDQILLTDADKTEGEPSVKYRGIFINDERNFMTWAGQFADAETPGSPNAGAYEKVFELLLRLKANTLWPAMHNYSDAFNLYEDENGISINAQLADRYGIIMGSSHCEMLLRNNEGEWYTWANAHQNQYDAKGTPVYDYTINPLALEAYWRERVEKNKDFEGIYNIGMRGIHDTGMEFGGLTNPTLADKIAVLQQVIDCQRRILEEVIGKPADQIPQAFIPYKEAATYYNGDATTPGVQIPDDVILMWAEDNHGYLRQTPTAEEQQRSGGSGVYYHVSYWGVANTSYLWLNTTPLSQMYEELKKAYDTGSRAYWILNVGDIKPSEVSLEFFTTIARDINAYDDTTIPQYLAKVAQRDYLVDEATAAEVADIMVQYYQYNIAKRPEFQGYESTNPDETYSIVANGDEGQIRVNQLDALVERAEAVYRSLPAARRDAFYQMIYYPLRASAFSLEMHIYYQKNQLYAQQGRYGSVEKYAQLSTQAYQNILNDLTYYNQTMQDGKWNKIINPYNNTNGFPVAVGLRSFATVSAFNAVTGIGAVCEGQTLPSDDVTLTFSSLSDNCRFLDIYSREDAAHTWTVEASDDFIVPSKTQGTVDVEERIYISIDWSKAQDGDNTGTITVRDDTGFSKTFRILAHKSQEILPANTYAEENGQVVLEAEHYTESVAVGDTEWRLVESLGRSGDSMKVYPDQAVRVDSDFATQSAQLKYDIYFDSTGTFTGTLYRIPTLNEGSENGVAKTCRIAVGLEGDTPQVLSGCSSAVDVSEAWKRNTLQQIEKLTFTIRVTEPGIHTLVVYRCDAGIAFDRITIHTGGEQHSYLGGFESYNSTYGSHQLVSVLPEPADLSGKERQISLYRSSVGASQPIPVEDYLRLQPGEYAILEAALPESLSDGGAIWTVDTGADLIDLIPRTDGKYVVGGNAVGRALLRIAAADNAAVARYCLVEVTDTPDTVLTEFREESGKVMIDISSALEQSCYAGMSGTATHFWRLNADANALTLQPDIGIQWNATSANDTAYLDANAARLNFQIEFQTAGTYYIHTLSSHPLDSSDSYHVGLDGVWQCHTNYAQHNGSNRWEKYESSWKIMVDTPGVHTLNIWAREDGIVSHRIYLTTQAGESNPSGWGPAESPRNTQQVGDSSDLTALVNANVSRISAGYTEASWSVFEAAYADAVAALANTYATQTQLDTAATVLETAVSQLEAGSPVTAPEIQAAIAALPDRSALTLADADAVAAVRAMADQLTSVELAQVPNYTDLEILEQDLLVLAAEPDGDVSQDGTLSVSDVVMLRKCILSGQTVSAAQFHRGDLDQNGALTVSDVVKLRKKILGS